jgi:glucose-6-phosphate-specific signal transduction histidine kinase
MLMTNSVQVTILGLLILITFVNVGLIAYPFGWQGEVTTALNNSKASSIDGNRTFTPHGANFSATLPLLVLSLRPVRFHHQALVQRQPCKLPILSAIS